MTVAHDSTLTASVLWALDHRIAIALNSRRHDDAVVLGQQMIDVISSRESISRDAVHHVANVGYGFTGFGENKLALDLLEPLTGIAARETPADRTELAVAITYRILAATHVGDADALQEAMTDLGQFPEELERALELTLERVLAGTKSRQVDAGQVLLTQKNFAEAMNQPEKARAVKQRFIDMFADSEFEHLRHATRLLIKQQTTPEPPD